MRVALPLVGFLLAPGSLACDEPIVANVEVSPTELAWQFVVAIAHDDTGWQHFAHKWQVLAPDDTVLGYGEVPHPHELEQPFSSPPQDVLIPHGITRVRIRAHCNMHGWGTPVWLNLPPRSTGLDMRRRPNGKGERGQHLQLRF
jgi:hypothetical protein